MRVGVRVMRPRDGFRLSAVTQVYGWTGSRCLTGGAGASIQVHDLCDVFLDAVGRRSCRPHC